MSGDEFEMRPFYLSAMGRGRSHASAASMAAGEGEVLGAMFRLESAFRGRPFTLARALALARPLACGERCGGAA